MQCPAVGAEKDAKGNAGPTIVVNARMAVEAILEMRSNRHVQRVRMRAFMQNIQRVCVWVHPHHPHAGEQAVAEIVT